MDAHICTSGYIYSFILLFVLSIQGLSGTLVSFILFVGFVRARDAYSYKGGVMIRWLGHRDALWVPVYRAMLGGVRCGRVRGALLWENIVEGMNNADLWLHLLCTLLEIVHYIPLFILWL